MKAKFITSIRFTAVTAVILGITWSCQKEEELPPLSSPEVSPQISSHEGMIVLGKKLENPHILANMNKAYRSLLTAKGRLTDEVELDPTDLYVRFLPESYDEYEIIQDDTIHLFFDHPLDYEIETYGSYYHDPEIPDSLPTWQYSVWPIADPLPSLYYEILDSAFIPENLDPSTSGSRMAIDPAILDQLEEVSFILTENWEPEASNAKNCPDFYPRGFIRAEGIPIVGVQVVATNFLSNKSDYTNDQGYYDIDKKFKRSVKMHVKWQRYQFNVNNDLGFPAQHTDSEECGGWDVDFAAGSLQAYYAHIFRAAYHYQDIQGLRRPPQNGFFNFNMEIKAQLESDGGNHLEERRFLESWIHIRRWGAINRAMYATTIHELAHASHWAMHRDHFDESERQVKESWARGVEWVLTNMRYTNYPGGSTVRPNYTQVVVDMIDNPAPIEPATGLVVNQNNGSENLGQDNVNGYTIRQIEDALQGQRTWEGWRDNIINRYNNATEGNLNALFTHWN